MTSTPFIPVLVSLTATTFSGPRLSMRSNRSSMGTVNAAFPYLLTVCVVLFAFSTILSYSYYGKKAMGYIFGDSALAERIYDVVWLIAIVVGAAISLDTVIRFSDAMFFLLTVPNLLGIYLLAGVLKQEILGHREDVRTGQLPIVAREDRSTIMGKKMPATSDKDSGPGR